MEGGLNHDKFTVICWDPRGYGKSRPPERDFPVDFFYRDANDAAKLMEVSSNKSGRFREGEGIMGLDPSLGLAKKKKNVYHTPLPLEAIVIFFIVSELGYCLLPGSCRGSCDQESCI